MGRTTLSWLKDASQCFIIVMQRHKDVVEAHFIIGWVENHD